MVNSIRAYELNNKIANIDQLHIPVLSDKSKATLEKSLNIYFPPCLVTATSLEGRIHKLDETKQKITEATDNRKKDILSACLKTAVLVTLATATVLLGVFAGPAFIAIALVPFLVLSGIFLHHAAQDFKLREGSDIDINFTGYGTVVGFGLIFPLIVGCARPYFLKQQLQYQEAEINRQLDGVHAQNRNLLPQGYNFYHSWGQDMLFRLNSQVNAAQSSLEMMQLLPTRSLAGEKEIQDQLTELTQAQNELGRVAAFYHQFDAI
jgi:hypothetical protein